MIYVDPSEHFWSQLFNVVASVAIGYGVDEGAKAIGLNVNVNTYGEASFSHNLGGGCVIQRGRNSQFEPSLSSYNYNEAVFEIQKTMPNNEWLLQFDFESVWVGVHQDAITDYFSSKFSMTSYLKKYTTFVINPTQNQFDNAHNTYRNVFLATHGEIDAKGIGYLQMGDGKGGFELHKLSELSASRIKSVRFGLAACYPDAQKKEWDKIGAVGTKYLDLSVLGYSEDPQGASIPRSSALMFETLRQIQNFPSLP